MALSLFSGAVWLTLAAALATLSLAPNRLARAWMGAFFACVGFLQVGDYLYASDLYLRYPLAFAFTDLFQLPLAPAFYLSVRQFTSLRPAISRKDLWHFLPAGLYLLAEISFFLLPYPDQVIWDADSAPVAPGITYLIIGLWAAQIGAYLLASLWLIYKHQGTLKQLAARTDGLDLRWMTGFFVSAIALFGFWLWEQFSYPYTNNHLSAGAYILTAAIMGYFALNQRAVFPFSEKYITELEQIVEEKPVQTTVSESEKVRLVLWMEKEKPYLDPDLNLPGMAEKLGMTVHALSHLLNTGLGENFFQFVNRYRVAESQRLLTDPAFAHYSMVAIAFEAGFNSKTTFNTTFKRLTGMSPSDFRAKAQIP